MDSFLHLSGYRFFENPAFADDREVIKDKAVGLGLKGTVILSPEGINCGFSGGDDAAQEFGSYLRQRFGEFEFRRNRADFPPYTRMLVKLKDALVPLEWQDEAEFNLKKTPKACAALAPEELKAWYDRGDDFAMLDVRNDYEVRLGTFRGAQHFDIATFREFPDQLRRFQEEHRHKPVVMFCTGGIRCEKVGPFVAQELGLDNMRQLEGGILKYFEQVGGEHYDGDCYVYDQRVALKPSGEESAAVMCLQCGKPVSEIDQQSSKFIPQKQCPHCPDNLP